MNNPDHANTFKDRNPSVQHVMTLLRPNPNLPKGIPADISDSIWGLANRMVDYHNLQDSPELTEGLRKLWEAKNSLVAAAILFND